MATVIGRPLETPEPSAVEVVQLKIITAAEEWENLFDAVEVWRSTTSPAGPFYPLTDTLWRSARIPVAAGDPPAVAQAGGRVILDNMALLLRVGADTINVTFPSRGVVSLGDAAAEVSAQGRGLLRSYVDAAGALVVESSSPGLASSIEVLGGEAAVRLGLPTQAPASFSSGKDAHIALIRGQQQYTFTDPRGHKLYFYRTRFVNTASGALSSFSVSFSVGQALGISPSSVVCGYVDLVGTDGRPLAGQLVQVYAPRQHALVEGKLVTGPRQAVYTDGSGHAEVTLVRGVVYTVSITGTDLVREVQAPVDPSISYFSLFERTVGVQDDLFKVARPDLVYAEKRTL